MSGSAQHPDVQDSTTVMVIGGGTMGAGIAATAVLSGLDVHLVERDQATAGSARAQVEQLVDRSAPDVDVTPGTLATWAGMPAGAEPDLIVESVSENVDLKLHVLTEASDRYPHALLTTNTSSLSIELLAQNLPAPERFLGLHFFNPVTRSRLIEIVHSARTHPDAVRTAEGWARRFGKQSIVVADSPGFATSRLGIAIGLEAMRMVEEGVASCADIDKGMVLGYKLPIGPLELSDMVGLDVRLAIALHLQAELGTRFEPPRILMDKVEQGQLGIKSGQGFYEWHGRKRLSARSDATEPTGTSRTLAGQGRSPS